MLYTYCCNSVMASDTFIISLNLLFIENPKLTMYEVSSKTNATPPISQSRDVWRINLIKYNTKIGQFPSTLFFIICF